MDFTQSISLILMAFILFLAIWRNINIGLLGFGATALLILVSHWPVDSGETTRLLNPKIILGHFPGSIFVLLVGVSLLFAHLEKSGGLSWFANKIYQAIGERTQIIPWVGFLLGVVFTTAGAFATATIALLVPVIASLCHRRPQIFFISEMAAIIGANGAGLSPINPVGNVVRNAAETAKVQFNSWEVWAFGVVLSAITVLILQILFSAKYQIDETQPDKVHRRGFLMIRPAQSEGDSHLPLQPLYAVCSLLGVLSFISLVIFAKADVGLTSITLAVLLMLIFPGNSKNFLHKIPWNAIVVLCGLLTFIGAMAELNTMNAVEEKLISMTSSPIILLFLIAYLTTFLSNVEASTLGVIGLMSPMVLAIFGASPHISLIIAAILAPATLSVVNPIHVAGTLVIGFTQDNQQNTLFRRLITITGCIVLAAPFIVCLLPVLVL